MTLKSKNCIEVFFKIAFYSSFLSTCYIVSVITACISNYWFWWKAQMNMLNVFSALFFVLTDFPQKVKLVFDFWLCWSYFLLQIDIFLTNADIVGFLWKNKKANLLILFGSFNSSWFRNKIFKRNVWMINFNSPFACLFYLLVLSFSLQVAYQITGWLAL